MPQPIMNPNYFNPQYRTPMYGQFMPQQDKEAKVRDLNTYMTELANDMTEIINDATPEEKTVLRNKLSALITKIG